MSTNGPTTGIADFRSGLVEWIDLHLDQLRPPYRDHGTTASATGNLPL